VITVDSSVWIAHMRGLRTDAVWRLETLVRSEPVVVGDLVLLELLQGARDDAHAERIERAVRRFEVVRMLDDRIAARAAWYYRHLRGLGVTVRRTTDLIIGTWCIENRCRLLHDDRDFGVMARYLGLVVV
jgi:predicted nucleic acid-binding protein